MSNQIEAENHLKFGNDLYGQGNYIEACKEYQRATEKDPNYVYAYNNWGLALANLKKYDEAIEKYQKAIEKDPNYVDAYNNWGLALANLKKYDEAIKKYQKAIEKDPNYVKAYRNWGIALANLKKYDEAIEKYQKAIEKDPNYVKAYRNWGIALANLKKYDEAIEKYQKAIEKDPNYAPAYNGWGNVLYYLKRYDEAIEKYQKAIEKDSNYAPAYNGWGNVVYYLKRYDEAIEKYQKAIEKDPNYAYAYRNWGLVLRNLKRYEEAIEKYQKAIEKDPDYADAYNDLGIALANLKKYDEAIEKFQKTIEKDPNYAYAYNNWGLVLTNLKRYEEAIEKFQKTIEKDPNFAYAYHNIAYCLLRQGKYKASLEEWEKARQAYEKTKQKAKDSNNADHFLYYGSVLYEVFGELNEAEEVYKEGLRLDPNDIGILTGLVNLYLEKKDEVMDEKTTVYWHPEKKDEDTEKMSIAYWKAREYYKKAEGILKDQLKKAADTRTCLQLGELQLTMLTTKEEYTEAEDNLKKALEGDKESPTPYADLGVLYSRKEEFKKAVEYFEAAFRQDPDDFTIRSNMAEAYLKLEKLEKAEAEYKKILGITPYHVESHVGLGEVYTAMGTKTKDVDMYDQAITHFTEAVKIAQSGNSSKRLKKKELAVIFYSSGYARVKLYEASTIRDKDESLLYQALDNFKKCFDNDPDHHNARRAKEKLEKRLSRFSPQRLIEKVGPWLISVLSLIILILSQGSFFFGKPLFIYGPNKSITEGYYVLLTLGSLIFMVAGLSLPQLLKLKVAGIELEKSSVEQITTPSTLGISK